ncbi:MAG: hypothetical protein ACJATA_002046 [Sphingobacteriales bacterium]|jgi:hypothetical protein
MKKLKLKDLKVQSFVTSMDKTEKKTIKGGWPETVDKDCTVRFDVCNKTSIGRAFGTEGPGVLIDCYHDL